MYFQYSNHRAHTRNQSQHQALELSLAVLVQQEESPGGPLVYSGKLSVLTSEQVTIVLTLDTMAALATICSACFAWSADILAENMGCREEKELRVDQGELEYNEGSRFSEHIDSAFFYT